MIPILGAGHPAAREAVLFPQPLELHARLVRGPLPEEREQRLGVGGNLARFQGGEAGVLGQRRVSHRHAEALELLVPPRGQGDEPVAARQKISRHDGLVAVPHRAAVLARQSVADPRPVQGADEPFRLGEVDELALAGFVAVMERHQRGGGSHQPPEPVPDEDPAQDRRAAGEARDPDHAAHRLRHGVVGGAPLGERPPLAEARVGHVDQARVRLAELPVADLPLVEGARPEILHEDVGLGRQPLEELLALGGVEVDPHVVLGVIRGEEPERRVLPVGGLGRHVAHGVAPGGQLHLDDLGAELAEEVGGGGSEDEGGQLEDADPPQGLGLVEDPRPIEELPRPVEVGFGHLGSFPSAT